MIYGYVKLLLAAYGTQMFVSKCSRTDWETVDPPAFWKFAVDTIGTLVFLKIHEAFVKVKKSSVKATEAQYRSLVLSPQAIVYLDLDRNVA